MSKVIVTKSKLDTLNDTISTKSGTSADRTIDEMATAVASIPTGGGLDPLSNPATASDILSGKEAYDDQGDKLTGSYVAPTVPTLTNPATASDILSGKEAIDGSLQKITGSLVPPVDTGENGLLKRIIEGASIQSSNHVGYDSVLSQIGYYGLACLGSEGRFSGLNYEFFEFANVKRVTICSLGTQNCCVKRVKFNQNVNIDVSAFESNTHITIVDLAALTTTSNSTRAFYGASLDAFIIRSDTFCPLATSNFFGSSHPNMGIYVQPSLVNEYKTATNWSAWASVINPFYLAQTVADIQTLLDDSTVPVGSMIICDAADYTQKYTKKEAS